MAILKTVCFFHESAKFIVSNISQTQKKEHSKFDDICFIKFQLLITWQPNHGTKEEWEKGNE